MPGITALRATCASTIFAASASRPSFAGMILQGLLKHFRGLLRAAGEHAADPAETGRDCRLQRFGRREIDQPRRDRLRRHAVLDQSDQQRVENLGLLRRRTPAHDFQKRHAAEIDVPDQFVGQIVSAHHDALGRAPAHFGTQRLARFHSIAP